MRSLREQVEEIAADQENIGKLIVVIDEAVGKAAASTNLPAQEVMKILECTNVEMVSDLENVLEGDKRLNDGLDAAKLSGAIETTLAAISEATSLDTDQITTILSNKPGASVEDVAYRLYKQSRIDRADYA